MNNYQIWRIFKPMLQKFAIRDVIDPFNIHVTTWNYDQLTQGSYSMPKVCNMPLGAACAALTDGLTDQVRFAGTETQEGRSNCCAHGPWYSGQREAALP